MGLNEDPIEIKDPAKDPSLKYNAQPKIFSKTLLDAQRKEEQFAELKKLDSVMGNFKDIKGRLEDREACR